MRVPGASITKPQWQADPGVVFCPSCNYGCQKDWPECPMCGAALAGDVPGVPIILDEGTRGTGTTTTGEALKAAVLAELQAVVADLNVIGMDELAARTGSRPDAVARITRDLVAEGLVAGHVDGATGEFVSEITTAATPGMFLGGTDPGPGPVLPATEVAATIRGESSDVDDLVKDIVQSLELKRGYEFEGGRVHYKLVVKNNARLVIHEVKIYLDVPDSFKIDKDEIEQVIPVLTPGESRGLDFYLEPRKCGTVPVSATVLFKDIYGKRHAKLVPPVDVQVKTPVVEASTSSFERVKRLTDRMASDMKMFAIKDLDAELLFNAAFRAVSKFDMSCVHDDKTPSSLEAWFSAISKADNAPVVARVIVSTTENVLEVRVWCNDDKQLTGFLAKIITNLRDEIELIRRIKHDDTRHALGLMRVARNMEVLKNLAGLRWQAGDMLSILDELRAGIESTVPGIAGTGKVTIDEWRERLSTFKPSEHVPDDTGDELYDAVERWQKLVDEHLGAHGTTR